MKSCLQNGRKWVYFLFLVFLVSCSTQRYEYAKYFNDLPQSTDTVMNMTNVYNEPQIKTGDFLSINIVTLDQLSSAAVYQAPVTAGIPVLPGAGLNLPGSTPGSNTYYVEKDGTVELPLLNKVKLAGLTLSEAKDLLRAKFGETYKSFSLNVSFVNHHYTILGEVARPGTYDIPGDKIGILDALGYAGDITIFGKRGNVLLLRDSSDTKKHIVRLNLNSKNIISSPYYYLKENDIVYIEPVKEKLASTDAYRTKLLSILTASLTVIILFITRVIK